MHLTLLPTGQLEPVLTSPSLPSESRHKIQPCPLLDFIFHLCPLSAFLTTLCPHSGYGGSLGQLKPFRSLTWSQLQRTWRPALWHSCATTTAAFITAADTQTDGSPRVWNSVLCSRYLRPAWCPYQQEFLSCPCSSRRKRTLRLEISPADRDLGFLAGSKLNVRQQCALADQKANRTLRCTRLRTASGWGETLSLCAVQPHLQYRVWVGCHSTGRT